MNKPDAAKQKELEIIEQARTMLLDKYPTLKDILTTLTMIDWIYRFSFGAFRTFQLRLGPAKTRYTYRYKIEFRMNSNPGFDSNCYVYESSSNALVGEERAQWSVNLKPEEMFQKLIKIIGSVE